MRILHVVGARPNFMKVAPVHAALTTYTHVDQVLVHTGQHYDVNMSDIFFDQLAIPEPDVNLGVGSGSHTNQTARIMLELETVLLERKPDLVLVYGDVNSTVAAAMVCAKLLMPIGHVEAGLRSGDRTMPEEINRLVTDQLADLLFTPSIDGNENLAREGVPSSKVYLVGNVMIDSLVRALEKTQDMRPPIEQPFVLVTLHRPSNVDHPEILADLLSSLREISEVAPVIFPVHPRTRQRINELDAEIERHSRIRLLEPLGYFEFLALERGANAVITDSGGVQEETTFLGIPCLTVRENTERPVTVSQGTNQLIGRDFQRLKLEIGHIFNGQTKRGKIPDLWDGHTGERIADIITSQ